MWHDHATILGRGFLMITVHVLYDKGVFLTSKEYKDRTGEKVNVQAEVEQPEIYLLAMGSSSIEDQASVIADRLDCLQDLSTPTIMLFCGDHPAAQFERGTQKGGHYKCGGCGVRDSMMGDQAHALRCTWHSLADIQSLATAGSLGKTPGSLKPFEKLKLADLKEELRLRGQYNLDRCKPELQEELTTLLKGVQRVPSLLVLQPQQALSTYNLEKYTVLDCEPLHDVKGHLSNLFSEVPYILTRNLREKFESLLAVSLTGDKVTGSDLRSTAIKALVFYRMNMHPLKWYCC